MSSFGSTRPPPRRRTVKPALATVPWRAAEDAGLGSSPHVGSRMFSSGGPGLTHVDQSGKASMVDVGEKPVTRRSAAASARVLLGKEVFDLVRSNSLGKGDVLTTSELAGIMAAKHTGTLIPLCHNIVIDKVKVVLELDEANHAVHIRTEAHCTGKTGVEMEALTAASVAALTVYDMCKAVSHDITVTDLQLDHKAGGQRGSFDRDVIE